MLQTLLDVMGSPFHIAQHADVDNDNDGEDCDYDENDDDNDDDNLMTLKQRGRRPCNLKMEAQ